MALTVTTATAQIAAPAAEEGVCRPSARTIYYPHGEATPTEQAELVISRIGEEATRCRPEAIDLVSRIDPGAEGANAVSLAMSRLNGVAEALVASGFPADRIRVAAQGDEAAIGETLARSPMSEIVVLFRLPPNGADTAAAPVKSPEAKIPRGAI